MDMFQNRTIFYQGADGGYGKCDRCFEITLSNLKAAGEIDEQDLLDRAELLCSLGHTVLISKFQEYYKLVEYFNNYTKAKIGLTMGVNNLVDVFDEKYYRHLSGGILEASVSCSLKI